MKKIILLVAVFMATFQSYAQFDTIGAVNSYTSGPDVGYIMNNTGCSGANVACAIWNTTPLNFYHSFDIVFYANFTVVGFLPGADGICAVFGPHINPTSSLNGGGGLLGYYDDPSTTIHNSDFTQSIGIECDIFGNGSQYTDPTTPYVDHIMIAQNALITAGLGGTPVQADPAISNIKDGIFRKFEIKWDCKKDSISVYCQDTFRASYHFIPVLQFGGMGNAENVYWGITSATGYYCSRDSIKNIKVTIPDSCYIPPCFDTNCHPIIMVMPMPSPPPCTFKFTVGNICTAPGVIITLYDWNFGDGTPDVFTPADSVIHTFPPGGPYTVTLKKIIAYNTLTGECCEIGPYTIVPPPCHMHKDAAPETPVPVKGMVIFPNPTKGELNIQTTDFDISKVRIYDMVGKKLQEVEFNQSSSEKVNIQTLVNGNYIIQVTDKQGVNHSAKFVVQK